MATHYFQGVAERTVRQAFTEDAEAKTRVRFAVGVPFTSNKFSTPDDPFRGCVFGIKR